MDEEPERPKISENQLAPDLFADGTAGFYLLNGVVHVTLVSVRAAHDSGKQTLPTSLVVAARLALPVAAAQALACTLYDFLKQRGFDPAPKAADQIPVQ
jgi:hypothetical protein